jgi:hypothetical protein
MPSSPLHRIAARGARLWHYVDAKGQVLGRLAPQIARLLAGKHKPTFTSSVDGGDYVVVVKEGRPERRPGSILPGAQQGERGVPHCCCGKGARHKRNRNDRHARIRNRCTGQRGCRDAVSDDYGTPSPR